MSMNMVGDVPSSIGDAFYESAASLVIENIVGISPLAGLSLFDSYVREGEDPRRAAHMWLYICYMLYKYYPYHYEVVMDIAYEGKEFVKLFNHIRLMRVILEVEGCVVLYPFTVFTTKR